MVTTAFITFLAFACCMALLNWRLGCAFALLCGVLQDPARKLTTGTPVLMTYSVVLVYFVVLFATQRNWQRNAREFVQRFANLQLAGMLFFIFLVLAAINGLFTYGTQYWKVPILSLFVYCSPIPAVILGYAYLQREEQLDALFRLYATITSVAMIGTPLEYFRARVPALGTVALDFDYIRHLPGIQIRILSGFYRAPDIMGWHAATLTIIGIIMAVRARVVRRAWPWMLVASWGFLNCLISGRRKAVYMVAVFATVFLWRYLQRLSMTQIASIIAIAGLMGLVVDNIASSEESAVYTKGTVTSQGEIFERLEGGFIETIRQFGIMGAGLGTATQGVRHLLGRRENIGWQEGGLGKLAVELGVPGVIAAAFLAWTLMRTMMRISAFPDVRGSSQLVRAALFAIVVTNMVEFLVSAQAYSDAVLTLFTAFLLGCLFATAALDERLPQPEEAPAPRRTPALAPA